MQSHTHNIDRRVKEVPIFLLHQFSQDLAAILLQPRTGQKALHDWTPQAVLTSHVEPAPLQIACGLARTVSVHKRNMLAMSFISWRRHLERHRITKSCGLASGFWQFVPRACILAYCYRTSQTMLICRRLRLLELDITQYSYIAYAGAHHCLLELCKC